MSVKEELQEAREAHEKFKKLGAKREAKAEEAHEAIQEARDHIYRLRQKRKATDDPDLRDEYKARVDELEDTISDLLEHHQQSLENSEKAKDLRRDAADRIRGLKQKMASDDPDDRLVALFRNYGLNEPHAEAMIEEAKSANIDIALAAALCQQESGFKNVFGCDWGPGVAFCHVDVSKERAQQLRAGGKANGVGWTQLTSFEYVDAANKEGGVWEVRNQCRVGFRVLHGHIERMGERTGIGAYNGGEGNPQLGYADSVLGLKKAWEQRIQAALRQ
jgi:hypothetical protein